MNAMGLPLLSAPNWLDATYYPVSFVAGFGDWLPALPLENLKHPRFKKVARSNGVAATNTRFLLDLGTLRQIKSIAFPQSTVSRTGTVRASFYQIYGSGMLSNLVADTGVIDYWRRVYAWGSLPLEHPSWLDGKITEEDRQGYPMPFVYTLEKQVLARYVLVEINDPDNAAGFVDLPRFYVCPGWQPSTGIEVGASLGYTDPSQVQTSMGSVDFFDLRPGFRTCRFNIPYLSYDETFSSAWELIRKLKKTKELFFSLDPDDDKNVHRWSFPATCKEVPQVEFSESLYQSVTFELKEVVG